MLLYLGGITTGVGALVAMLAEVIAKQQLVVACPLGTIGATASGGNKLRVPLIERRVFQHQQDIGINPEMKTADGEKNASWLAAVAVNLFEARRERGVLLLGGQLRQQERVAYADFIGIEGFDGSGNKIGQLQSSSDKGRIFANPRAYLLDAVLGFFQVEEGAEALRLLHRVNVLALQVLDDGHLDGPGIGEMDDADRNGGNFGHLRGAVTPCSGDDLKPVLCERTHQQRRENALALNTLGQLLQSHRLKGSARIGSGFIQERQRDVAVFGGVADLGCHDGVLLSSGCGLKVTERHTANGSAPRDAA
jgi:hypothetical protein